MEKKMPQFTWIPIYHEIAEKLLPFQNNHSGLLEIVNKIKAQDLPVFSLDDKDKGDIKVPLTSIDPFTFFAIWNRGIRDQNRKDIIAVIQQALGIQERLPDDFSGIPVVNNQQTWFFTYKKDRSPDDIPLLWQIFREAMSNKIKPETFSSVLNIRCVRYNLTMGLFWIDPYNYLNLDGINRAYLLTKSIEIDDLSDYPQYCKYMEITKAAFKKPFYEISYEAWLQSKNTDEIRELNENPVDECTSNRYWLFAPGRNAEFWEEFYSAGIMAIGWDYLGDLKNFSNKEEIAEAIRRHDNDPDSSKKNNATSCYSFSNEMQTGDYVFAKVGRNRIVGMGNITSDYYFDEAREEYKHVRKVDWKIKGKWEVSDDNHFALKTLTDITRYTKFVNYLNALLGNKPNIALSNKENVAANNFWWLNANPKHWNFSNLEIGDVQLFTAYNKDNNKRQIFKYYSEAKPGDIVIGYVASPVKQVIAQCIVTKGLHNSPEGPAIEIKKTHAFKIGLGLSELKPEVLLEKCEPVIHNQGTLFSLTEEEFSVIRSMIDERNEEAPLSKPAPYLINDALSDLFMSEKDLGTMLSLLKYKKNLVLQGPPGVGKTYVAERLGHLLMGNQDDSRIETIQFHQSYSYEDFIQGIRPNTRGQFILKDGLFYRFCKRAALANKDIPYVFIIDEINRGNLSKVFGELMMLIEHDKRGQLILLANSEDSNDSFSIPANVYIIGTMNTADRSLAMVDYALRRRFCFFDIKPAFDTEYGKNAFVSYLQKIGASSELASKIVLRITALNARIREDSKQLGPGYEIGHSYFCTKPQVAYDETWYRSIIEFEIAPLLREYWFDNIDKANSHIEALQK
jgi:5-methylcytosine-specific restriction enzyme B